MSLEKAIKLAKGNPVQGLPKMAALIYDGKRLVGAGINSRKTHPLQSKFSKHPEAICIHAEIAAIADCRRIEDLSGMTMFIARVGHDGEPKLAKPCSGCQKAIIAFNLKDVIWTEEQTVNG